MKRFLIPTWLYLLFLVSCSTASDPGPATVLKDKKYTIDSLINKDRNLIVMAKVRGQDAIGAMPKDPAQVVVVYNILKDKNGRIVYISEMPKSPNDDWFIACKSYFDENGNLFAFQRQNNFFNSECTKGAALENLQRFYNDKFDVLDSVYTLTDSYKKDLTEAPCKFPYNFPYKIYKNVDEYRGTVKGL